MGERLSRSAPNERADEPGEDRGHISAKRNGLHLDVNSAILFFEAPIVAETPKIAVPLANGKLRAIRLLWMLQFSDSRRDCAAGRMRTIDGGVMIFEFGIEGNAAWRVLAKLEINFEAVIRVVEKLGAANVGVIGAPMVV